MTTPITPPRLPLRVLLAHQEPPPEGNTVADQWQIVRPDDPDYDRVYHEAAEAWRQHATSMPFASDDAGDEPTPNMAVP